MADALQSGVQDGSQVSRLQQAFQRVFADIQAVELHELIAIKLDIGSVYTLGTGVLLKVSPFREQLLTLPFLKRELVEKMEDYLLAMGHAHSLFLAATAPVASVPELFSQLTKAREILVADATALQKRGLLPDDNTKGGPMGYSAMAFDVLARCALLRANWANIQGKTALQLADIEQAETLSDQLLSAVGERAVSDEEASAASLNRQRAYTLFMRAYDEVRRGLAFIRYHERDVDELAPSPYVTRNGGKKNHKDGEGDDTPATPTLPTSGIPAATADASKTGDHPTSGAHPADQGVDGSPFVHS